MAARIKRSHITLGLSFALVAMLAGSADPSSSGFHASAPDARYLVASVEQGDIRTTLSATGTLVAVVTVKVSSQLSGRVSEVLVDFNDNVTKGQTLARLDASTFAARVRQAQAGLEAAKARVSLSNAALDRATANVTGARTGRMIAAAYVQSAQAKADSAKRDLDRKRALADRAVVAQSTGDDALTMFEAASAMLVAARAEQANRISAILVAEADRRIAEAQLEFAEKILHQQEAVLELAQVDLANTVIRAPIDGEIIGRDIDRGQTVATSLSAPTLFTIAQDLRQMEVHAKIDEADIGRVHVGQASNFTVDAYPARTFSGRVTQIRKAPGMSQNVITYTAVLTAPNPDLKLLPGMTAMVQIIVEQADNVLKIPNAALRFVPPPHEAGRILNSGEAMGLSPARGADGGHSSTVWTLDERGAASPVRVKLGRNNTNATEVVAGPLEQGQTVIIGTASRSHRIPFFSIR